MRALVLVILGVWTIGCSKKATTKATQVPATPAASAEAKAEPPAVAASPNLGASEDLALRCKLALGNVEEAPKFAYDGFDLLPSDRTLLEKIASCVTTGPLRGARLQLVGRADPRGTQEYNLALGDRRADAVGAFLQRLGVPSAQLSVKTRGDLDSGGADEASWQRDRRVDLLLL